MNVVKLWRNEGLNGSVALLLMLFFQTDVMGNFLKEGVEKDLIPSSVPTLYPRV